MDIYRSRAVEVGETLYQGTLWNELRVPNGGSPHYEPQTLHFSGASFVGCTFVNCWLNSVRRPDARHILRNLRFDHCTVTNCNVFTAALVDVVIDTLNISGGGRVNHLTVEGCVFKHVTLRGKFNGRLQFNPGPDSMKSLRAKNDPTYEPGWHDFYRSYYQDCDWALDISKAQFSSGPWLGFVPGHLVRRDPETQVLVTRARLAAVKIDKIPFKSPIATALKVFLERGQFDSLVVGAFGKGEELQDELDDLQTLRKTGLANAD